MTRILILGAGGMLGHKLVQLWSTKYFVVGTVRKPWAFYDSYEIFDKEHLVDNVDVGDFAVVENVISRVQPDFIVNCVGVIKQLDAANDPVATISINSLFPHKIARLCRAVGARLIHISTYCVFSGNRGMYKETDPPDATDLYGRTKLLGEVISPHCLTLRTSIIGRELITRNGLIEWFLQSGQSEVLGFRRAIYTGLTTIELARVLLSIMEAPKWLNGIYQVSSDPISKYELLLLVRKAYGVSTEIIPTDTPAIDRSLDSTQFRQKLGYTPPSWPSMIEEMASDKTDYWRKHGSEK
jgi:dTDP-4-dehydrorhamnose reductase